MFGSFSLQSLFNFIICFFRFLLVLWFLISSIILFPFVVYLSSPCVFSWSYLPFFSHTSFYFAFYHCWCSFTASHYFSATLFLTSFYLKPPLSFSLIFSHHWGLPFPSILFCTSRCLPISKLALSCLLFPFSHHVFLLPFTSLFLLILPLFTLFSVFETCKFFILFFLCLLFIQLQRSCHFSRVSLSFFYKFLFSSFPSIAVTQSSVCRINNSIFILSPTLHPAPWVQMKITPTPLFKGKASDARACRRNAPSSLETPLSSRSSRHASPRAWI